MRDGKVRYPADTFGLYYRFSETEKIRRKGRSCEERCKHRGDKQRAYNASAAAPFFRIQSIHRLIYEPPIESVERQEKIISVHISPSFVRYF